MQVFTVSVTLTTKQISETRPTVLPLFYLMGCSTVQAFLVLCLIKSKVPSHIFSSFPKFIERVHHTCNYDYNYHTLNSHLFSDWLKAYSEFLKTAPVTSSSCRLYDDRVKNT